MNDTCLPKPPGLLVSVRDATEAIAALAGGADVIDVKEPDRGSLGPADITTIEAVVRAVNGRAAVTAAAGELLDLPSSNFSMPDGVALFKIGLAGCRGLSDWLARWKSAVQVLSNRHPSRPVAVAYADWERADSPEPRHVLSAAVQFGCPALLIDTWDKSGGSLLDHWPASELASFVRKAQSHDLTVVLAGSLVGDSVVAAAQLQSNLIAVRTAACDAGRSSSVSSDRVRALRQTISAACAGPAEFGGRVGIAQKNMASSARTKLSSRW
jgi:uncharacterized protein (UPF0264 family)